MAMPETSQKILLIGGVALMRGRVPAAGPVMVEVCNEWEPRLRELGFVENAPFKTISLIIRFGDLASEAPVLSKVDERTRELPVAFELPMPQLRDADRERLKELFGRAAELTLEAVARKYGLPFPSLLQIPDTPPFVEPTP
jgi:hypothetical protein